MVRIPSIVVAFCLFLPNISAQMIVTPGSRLSWSFSSATDPSGLPDQVAKDVNPELLPERFVIEFESYWREGEAPEVKQVLIYADFEQHLIVGASPRRSAVERVELNEKAQRGDAEALYQLGIEELNRRRGKRSSEAAYDRLQKAARKGHAAAQNALGVMCLWGDGSFQDFREAERWLETAANAGSTDAAYNLGYSYFWNLLPTSTRFSTAEHWLRKAAKRGHANAKVYLAMISILEEDLVEAYEWLVRGIAGGADSRAYRDLRDALLLYNKISRNDAQRVQAKVQRRRDSRVRIVGPVVTE